jgi:hypothetical protein
MANIHLVHMKLKNNMSVHTVATASRTRMKRKDTKIVYMYDAIAGAALLCPLTTEPSTKAQTVQVRPMHVGTVVMSSPEAV